MADFDKPVMKLEMLTRICMSFTLLYWKGLFAPLIGREKK